MDIGKQIEILESLQETCTASASLWNGKAAARLYLKCSLGEYHRAYIHVDSDGDLVGEGPKLSRTKAAQLWGPWERAAKTIGRKLYA